MSLPYLEYHYTGSDHSHPDLAKKIIRTISKCAGIRSICELGCGSGWVANQLASQGYEVVAVDASESGIRAAKLAAKSAIFHCDVIDIGLAARLGGMSFDMVLSSEVIEHLYRPAALLEAASELLKSDGLLVISTPYHGYFKYLALALLGKMERHLTENWDGGHIKFFSFNSALSDYTLISSFRQGCQNPGCMDSSNLTISRNGYPLLANLKGYHANLTK